MTPIGSILERNMILNGADVLTAKGYTQIPNHVLVSDRLLYRGQCQARPDDRMLSPFCALAN